MPSRGAKCCVTELHSSYFCGLHLQFGEMATLNTQNIAAILSTRLHVSSCHCHGRSYGTSESWLQQRHWRQGGWQFILPAVARDLFLLTKSQVRRKIGICDRWFMEANMVKFSRQILPAIKTLKSNELSLNGNEKRVWKGFNSFENCSTKKDMKWSQGVTIKRIQSTFSVQVPTNQSTLAICISG